MINLKAFCTYESTRYDIDRTWVRDGFEYATNDRIIIRIKTDIQDMPKTEGRFPNPVDPKFPWGLTGKKIAWPKLVDPPEYDCDECNGTGKEHIICDDCMKEIQTRAECLICEGKGKVGYPEIVQMGNKYFNRKYIMLVQQNLPNPFYILNPENDKIVNEPLYFVFDGGEGLLMSRTKE